MAPRRSDNPSKLAFVGAAPEITMDEVVRACGPGTLEPRVAATGKGSVGWKLNANATLGGFPASCSFHVNVDHSADWKEAEKESFPGKARPLKLADLRDKVSFKMREPHKEKTVGWFGCGSWKQGPWHVRASFNVNVLDSAEWPMDACDAEDGARSRSRSPRRSGGGDAPDDLPWAELVEALGGEPELQPQIAKTGQKTVGWRYHRAKGLEIRGRRVSAFLNVNVLKSGTWTDKEKTTWEKRMPPLDRGLLGDKLPILKREGEGWSARNGFGWSQEVAGETMKVNAQLQVQPL